VHAYRIPPLLCYTTRTECSPDPVSTTRPRPWPPPRRPHFRPIFALLAGQPRRLLCYFPTGPPNSHKILNLQISTSDGPKHPDLHERYSHSVLARACSRPNYARRVRLRGRATSMRTGSSIQLATATSVAKPSSPPMRRACVCPASEHGFHHACALCSVLPRFFFFFFCSRSSL